MEVNLSKEEVLVHTNRMNVPEKQQVCPRCSMPGGDQHLMKRMRINFTESVDMCPNSKCMWVQLVSGNSETDCSTQLPGGLSTVSSPGDGVDGDEFDQLLTSLCEPSVDSGVDADSSIGSWEPAVSDADSLCSELAGVGLSSAASVAGGGWRAVSLPAGALSSIGSLPAETRSEPDPASLRRAVRRGRLDDRRAGLALRTFNNSETRQPNPNEGGGSNRIERARRKLKKANQEAAAAAKVVSAASTPAAASSAATSVLPAAVAGPSSRPASSASSSAVSTRDYTPAATRPKAAVTKPAPAAPLGPPRTQGRLPPARHARTRDRSESAARMASMLDAPELLSLRSSLKTDQMYVRSKQVERVRAWARKKTGTAGRQPAAAGVGDDRSPGAEKHCQMS